MKITSVEKYNHQASNTDMVDVHFEHEGGTKRFSYPANTPEKEIKADLEAFKGALASEASALERQEARAEADKNVEQLQALVDQEL